MNITPGQHALLAAGLLVVAAGLFYFILVWPALAGRTAFQERLEGLQFQQQKLIEAAAMNPILEQELAVLSGLDIDRSGFLEQKPRDLAAADLQRQLSLLIEETGGSLVSTQVLPGQDEDDSIFPEISLKLRLRGTIESVRQLLYRFDTGQLRLFVDNLLVQKRQRGDEQARRDSDQLDIRLDVSAFIYQSDQS